jgi:hypothetical protein
MHTKLSHYEKTLDHQMKKKLEAERLADLRLVQQLQGQKRQGALRYVCMY